MKVCRLVSSVVAIEARMSYVISRAVVVVGSGGRHDART
jgi:hypothetical protein